MTCTNIYLFLLIMKFYQIWLGTTKSAISIANFPFIKRFGIIHHLAIGGNMWHDSIDIPMFAPWSKILELVYLNLKSRTTLWCVKFVKLLRRVEYLHFLCLLPAGKLIFAEKIRILNWVFTWKPDFKQWKFDLKFNLTSSSHFDQL